MKETQISNIKIYIYIYLQYRRTCESRNKKLFIDCFLVSKDVWNEIKDVNRKEK